MSYSSDIKTIERHVAEHHMSYGVTTDPPSNATNRPRELRIGTSSRAHRAERRSSALLMVKPCWSVFMPPNMPGFWRRTRHGLMQMVLISQELVICMSFAPMSDWLT